MNLTKTSHASHAARASVFTAIIAFLAMLPGCAVIGGIFKAGVWVGVIAVVGVLVIGGGIAALLGGKK
jgi:hypothetical protein